MRSERISTMKQYTTCNHLTRTIHQLEHILADETFPAIRAAEVLAATLLELYASSEKLRNRYNLLPLDIRLRVHSSDSDSASSTWKHIAPLVPEADQQIREIVELYGECADRQYGPLYKRQHGKQCH